MGSLYINDEKREAVEAANKTLTRRESARQTLLPELGWWICATILLVWVVVMIWRDK